MDEIRNQTESQGETGEARSLEQQSLDDATLNPRAYVEQTGDYRQAEAIQAGLEQVMATEQIPGVQGGAETVSVLPLPLPHPQTEEAGLGKTVSGPEQAGTMPIPIPTPKPESGTAEADSEQVSSLPEPIPTPRSEAEMAGVDQEQVSSLPLPLPHPQPEGQSVADSRPGIRGDLDQLTAATDDGRHDATPIPLPGQEGQTDATPITLPAMRVQADEEEEGHPPEPPDLNHNPYPEEVLATLPSDSVVGSHPQVRGDLYQVTAGTDDGRHDATPIPLPGQEGVVGSQPHARDDLDQATAPGGDNVTPINLPGPQAASITNLGATPQPIPRPEDDSIVGSQPRVRDDLDQATMSAGDEPGGKDATPINLPGPQAASLTDLGATPQPIPRPEDEGIIGSQPRVRDDLGQATMAGSSEPGGKDATPINLPGPQVTLEDPGTGPMPPDHSSRLGIAAGDASSRGPMGNRVAAQDDWEAPNANLASGDEPGDARAGTPEVPLREANFQEPLEYEELTDKGLSNLDNLDSLIPGPGKLGGALGGEDPGSDLLSGLGFDGGPENLTNDPGGIGSDPNDLFGPGGGPPGAEMMGIEGKGENIFWSWNFVPGQESRYTFAKDLAEADHNAETIQPLTYDPAWEAVPKGETIDPFDDTTPATKSDYDEQEKEMTAFTNAQKQMEEEKAKQEEARRKRQGASESPDEGDDYSRMQTTGPLGAPNPQHDPGQISNYPEDHIEGNQGGGMLKPEAAEIVERSLEMRDKLTNATPKVTTDQVTDPPEPEPGKKSETTGKGS